MTILIITAICMIYAVLKVAFYASSFYIDKPIAVRKEIPLCSCKKGYVSYYVCYDSVSGYTNSDKKIRLCKVCNGYWKA